LPKAQNGQVKRHWSWIARTAVALGAIALFCHNTNWRDVADRLRGMNLWCFAIVVVTFATAQIIQAFRWRLLLRTQSIQISMLTVIKLYYLGLYYNNVMPGSVGGDLLKAWYVMKHTDRRFEGALSVVVDRVIGLATTLMIAAVAAVYILRARGRLVMQEGSPQGGLTQRSSEGLSSGLLWIGAAVVVLFLALLLHPRSRAWLKGIAAHLAANWRIWVAKAVRAAVVYSSKPLTIVWTVLLTALGQGIVVVAFWYLGDQLGIQVGLEYYLLIFPASWVLGAVPISIAGLGVTEGTMVAMFVILAGADKDAAKALAICQRLVWVLASLPGGLIHMLGAHLPKEFFVDAENPVN
jgi:glycosyltransferase 2 family protein